ncbi:MAG TPA: hypothetical protein PLI11_09825 [Clostridia bacterium]|mgnify:CR=1 FL=1|jgi:hypothetical protein|nr:hypothetical protein [Clostridiaceae bacterium]HOA30571.1 hypothetical protein [Clostridia bacterium]HPZ53206.1 hypothetical protein [Clostridia bacterium]
MINKFKRLDKSFIQLFKQLSQISASALSAGIWTSILCSIIGICIMLYLYIGGNATPTIFNTAKYIIKSGTGMLLLAAIVAVIVEFVKMGEARE